MKNGVVGTEWDLPFSLIWSKIKRLSVVFGAFEGAGHREYSFYVSSAKMIEDYGGIPTALAMTTGADGILLQSKGEVQFGMLNNKSNVEAMADIG